jgi:stage II sporulation protein P
MRWTSETKQPADIIKSMVLLQLALIAIIAALSADLQGRYVSITGAVDPGMIMAPLSGFLINNQLAELFFQESNVLLGGRLTQERLAGGILKTLSPRSLIGANILAVAYTGEADQAEEEPGESGEDSINADTVVRQTPQEEMDTEVPKDCPVFLYCTHSAETYVPDSGKARLDGQKGLINTVAATLARECNKRGLSAVFIDTIHDYPNYNKSYSNSRHTVSNIVKSNPQIGALFDIHRDSIPNVHQASRVKINGEYCSQILIIVGSNERKPPPTGRKITTLPAGYTPRGKKCTRAS